MPSDDYRPTRSHPWRSRSWHPRATRGDAERNWSKLPKEHRLLVLNDDDPDSEWLYDEAAGPPDPHRRRPNLDWVDDPLARVCELERDEIRQAVRVALMPPMKPPQPAPISRREAMLRSSINHSTIISALEMIGGGISHPHHKTLELLAKQLIRVPGNTLGENPPEVNRLVPSIEAMAKAGLITIKGRGHRISSIKLTGLHASQPVEDEDPDQNEHSALIIQVLAQTDGKLRDQRGYVTNVLIDRILEVDGKRSSRNVWRERILEAEQQGWLKRHTGATRTYQIELTEMGRRVAGLATNGHVQEAVPEEEPVPAAPEAEIEVVIEDDEYEETDSPLALLLEDEEICDAVTTLLSRIKESSGTAALTAANDQLTARVSALTKQNDILQTEVEDLNKLLRIADDDVARAKAETAEAESRVDRVGRDRDELRRELNTLLVRLDAYGLGNPPRS